MSDSKVPYFLAAGSIGCAVGYLFFTKQGRGVRNSVFSMETSSAIPDKIEDARHFIESRGQKVGDKLRSVVNHLKSSIDEGKQKYEQGGERLMRRMDKLGQANGEVVQNIHRAVDNLNKTFHTVEHTILEPIYEMASIAQGVNSGVRKLVACDKSRHLDTELHYNYEMPDSEMADKEVSPFFREPDPRHMMG